MVFKYFIYLLRNKKKGEAIKPGFFFILLLFYPLQIFKPSLPQFTVWNVGQGQWITYSTDAHCIHFDMGGEFYPKDVETLCKKKLNVVYFSHADWDHFRFTNRFKKQILNFCVAVKPWFFSKQWKQKYFNKLQSCNSTPTPPNQFKFSQHIRKNWKSNDTSNIFIKHDMLISGDSPSYMEKIWFKNIPKSTKYLFVGHHGSITSSSKLLLDHLTNLKMAFVSARKARYNHPHKKIMHRFAKYKIPVLKTEDWGNIRILINKID